jgi:3-isopropylmalate dehydrogenase
VSRQISMAVVPGDGVGPEVTVEAVKVLGAAVRSEDVVVVATEYFLGAQRFLETGEVLTEADLSSLSAHDVILLGAVGGVPGDLRLRDAHIERQLLLGLRFSFDHYVNVRPARLLTGVDGPLAHPGEVDFVVIREGTEGAYVGNGGVVRAGTVHEVANEVSVNTAFGVERVVRYAYEQARSRRGRLTLVYKMNVLTWSGGLWKRVVDCVGREYADVDVDYLHVDAAAMFLVTHPSRFDVIVTDNLFGDILTDLAAAVTGGIGLAASANINPERVFPSMFEPVHGSAPDIAGTQRADPTAAILSVALLLEHCGLGAAAERVRHAVAAHVAVRSSLPPAGWTTAAIGDAVAERLS